MWSVKSASEIKQPEIQVEVVEPKNEDVQKTVELVTKYKNGEYVIPKGLIQAFKQKLPVVNENHKIVEDVKAKKTKIDVNVEPSTSDKSENEFKKYKNKPLSPGAKNTSHQQSNTSQEEKYPEFVPTYEFQEGSQSVSKYHVGNQPKMLRVKCYLNFERTQKSFSIDYVWTRDWKFTNISLV